MSLVGFKAQNHPQQKRKPEIDDRGTDPELFASLNERFAFTLDVAASDHNAKCARYYTLEHDGLTHPWTDERVWCNPPYSHIEPWVFRAWTSAAELVVMLVPANRTEQKWWQGLVEPFRDNERFVPDPHRLTVEFLPGRPRFVNVGKPGIGPNERPPFGCCLLIWEAP